MMIDDDNDGQMIFGDLVGLKLPDISLTGEEKPRKNLTQETSPDRGSNPARCVAGAHATACPTTVELGKLFRSSVLWITSPEH